MYNVMVTDATVYITRKHANSGHHVAFLRCVADTMPKEEQLAACLDIVQLLNAANYGGPLGTDEAWRPSLDLLSDEKTVSANPYPPRKPEGR